MSTPSSFKRINVRVPADFLAAAKAFRLTPAACALAAFGIVLVSLNTGAGSLLIPFVASCRRNPGLMGMCAQTMPLRFTPGEKRFQDAARRVQTTMAESVSHWFVPQDIISALPRYLFTVEDGDNAAAADGEQDYDLVVRFSTTASLLYNTARVPAALAEELAGRFEAAMTAAAADAVSAYLPGEYTRVAEVFPHGEALAATPETVADALRRAAKAHADGPALETEDGTLSYAQLFEKAQQYADNLGRSGITTGHIAPVCLPRGAESVIAQVGVVLAGAALLPLDPDWPETRRAELLHTANSAALPPDTAYVLGTSGTTGKPKCAALPGGALANQIAWTKQEFDIGPGDKVLHYVNFTFDPSIWTIFSALCTGAVLVLMPECARLDPDAAARYIIQKGITVCILPSAVAPQVLARLGDGARLRLALLGGEAVKNLPARRSYTAVNCYGPTETCINASFYRLEAHETHTSVIGRPVAGTQLYVLDERGAPCPVGVPGQLAIGGAQLAHGYLGSPAETDAAFMRHPRFGHLYHTGDLAAWRPDGNLAFHGRHDRQVKIRGYRVELGEIEAALRALPGVADAAVVLNGGAPDAFITGEAAPEAVREGLARRLPSFMLPRTVTTLARLPLTAGGKIDFTALPTPQTPAAETRALTPAEQAVASAWRAALGLPESTPIAPGSRFDELGGHSLLLFHVVGLLAAQGMAVSIKTLIEHPRLDELAKALAPPRAAPAAQPPAVEQNPGGAGYAATVEAAQKLDLSQKRAWSHVLITGGTGFLGSHLIREFYDNTNAVLYLPLRGAPAKLRDTLGYYFGEAGLLMAQSERLRAYQANLADGPPPLPPGAVPNAIFHTAADIRHYAPDGEMHAANVTATEHMLALAAQHPGALFCHVSTTSAVNAKHIYETSRALGPAFENAYQRTKQMAERRVLDAANLRTAIFRVGHVSPGFSGGSVPRNWEINAMLRLINAMLLTGMLPEQDYQIGYGFVDSIALALRLLAEPVTLENQIFHIDNPNTLPLSGLFHLAGLPARVLRNNDLKKRLAALAASAEVPRRQAAAEYLGRLAQGSLEKEGTDVVQGVVHMDVTLTLLQRLGFAWPDVTEAYMRRIVHNLQKGWR